MLLGQGLPRARRTSQAISLIATSIVYFREEGLSEAIKGRH
jgi:hypothetical protein